MDVTGTIVSGLGVLGGVLACGSCKQTLNYLQLRISVCFYSEALLFFFPPCISKVLISVIMEKTQNLGHFTQLPH